MNSLQGVAGVTKSIATSSALNPTLILCAICTPTMLTAAYFATEPLSLMFSTFAFFPPVIACWQIVRFTLSDTDRLQNERHVENKMIISQQGTRIGSADTDIMLPANEVLQGNPALLEELGK